MQRYNNNNMMQGGGGQGQGQSGHPQDTQGQGGQGQPQPQHRPSYNNPYNIQAQPRPQILRQQMLRPQQVVSQVPPPQATAAAAGAYLLSQNSQVQAPMVIYSGGVGPLPTQQMQQMQQWQLAQANHHHVHQQHQYRYAMPPGGGGQGQLPGSSPVQGYYHPHPGQGIVSGGQGQGQSGHLYPTQVLLHHGQHLASTGINSSYVYHNPNTGLAQQGQVAQQQQQQVAQAQQQHAVAQAQHQQQQQQQAQHQQQQVTMAQQLSQQQQQQHAQQQQQQVPSAGVVVSTIQPVVVQQPTYYQQASSSVQQGQVQVSSSTVINYNPNQQQQQRSVTMGTSSSGQQGLVESGSGQRIQSSSSEIGNYNTQPRQKKILKIVDPNTGKQVIEDTTTTTTTASSTPTTTVPIVTQQPAVPIVTDTISQSDNKPIIKSRSSSPNTITAGAESETVTMETQQQDNNKKSVKQEFFRMITRSADNAGNTNTTAEPVAMVTSEDKICSSEVTSFEKAGKGQGQQEGEDDGIDATKPKPEEQEESIEQELNKVEIHEINKNLEKEDIVVMGTDESSKIDDDKLSVEESTTASVDDWKDSSLVSISPIPIEKYVVPSPIVTKTSGITTSVGGTIKDLNNELLNAENDVIKVDSVTDDVTTATSDVKSLENIKDDDVRKIRDDVSFVANTDDVATISIDDVVESNDDVSNEATINDVSTTDDVTAPKDVDDTLQVSTNDVTPVSTNDVTKPNKVGDDDVIIVAPQSRDEEDKENEREEGELLEDSPSPASRLIYDRDILLTLKSMGTTKPSCIPPELRADKSSGGNIGGSAGGIGGINSIGGMFPRGGMMSSSLNPGGPPFNTSNNRGMSGGSNRRNDGGKMSGGMHWGSMGPIGSPMPVPPPFKSHQPPKILSLVREKVDLHKAESAWKPSVKEKKVRGQDTKNLDDEQVLKEEIVKKTRGILNKLTPENFEKLVQKFLQLNLEDKDERIGAVILVVFEKAIDEPSFSTAYARMVHAICQRSQETSKKFRKKILDQCQQEFQQGNTDEEYIKELEIKLLESNLDETKKKEIQFEIDEKRYTSRRRSLGNVRFIGELYKLGMLTPKIMVECINMLIASVDEESLECLCKLLTTIGQKLEESIRDIENSNLINTKEKKAIKWIPEIKYMENIFKKLKELSINKNLSSRIRFALLDVYELRDSNWKPRRDTNAPKTINEVRRDAVLEEEKEHKKLMSLPISSGGPPSGGGGSRDRRSEMSSQNQNKKPSNDWNTVQSNKSSRFTQQLKKPSGTSSSNTNELPVFAPTISNWSMRSGQGLSMSSSSSQQKSGNTIAPRFSRFNALATDEINSRPPPLTPSREEIVQPVPPSRFTTSSNSSNQNRSFESSSSLSANQQQRPSTPLKETKPLIENNNIKEIPCNHGDDGEAVKNIFEEFINIKKLDDTIHWISQRFEGPRINEFLDLLVRQIIEMSKEDSHRSAGQLIKMLIKRNFITKEQVLENLSNGLVLEIPDIEVDVPKVTSYFSIFITELFSEEENLNWLLELTIELKKDFIDTFNNIIKSTLNYLKLKKSLEIIKSLIEKTKLKSELPINEIDWLIEESNEEIIKKMKRVLVELDSTAGGLDNINSALQENSWDLRQEPILVSFIQAICSLSWNSSAWDLNKLNLLLPQIRLSNPKAHSITWRSAKEFIKLENIQKADEELLWNCFLKYNLITKDEWTMTTSGSTTTSKTSTTSSLTLTE